MKNRKSGQGYTILLITTILLTMAGIITLLPFGDAEKINILGYHSICTFAPFSTIICLLGAGTSCKFRSKLAKV